MLILTNILGFAVIVLLGAGLWALLSALLVALLTLGCTAWEGGRAAAGELPNESFDRLLVEIGKSERVLEAIDAEIASIQGTGRACPARRH